MKSSVVLASLLTIGLASCAHSVRSTDRLSIAPGPCFGSCPVEEIGVVKPGTVSFQGIRHTAYTGTKQVQVAPAVIETLEDKLEPFKPLTRHHIIQCDEAASDQPTFTVRRYQEENSRILVFDASCSSEEARKLRSTLENLPADLQLREEATRLGVPRRAAPSG